MPKVKRSLKAALQAQLTKLSKQKHDQAVKSAKESKVASVKKRGRARVVIPFERGDKILLVGEGDFSFAVSLVQHHRLLPTDIVATGYESSESDCFEKYPDSKRNVSALRKAGVQVLLGIDATKLETYKELKKYIGSCDRVVFNFPHTGKGIKDQDRNILSNQQLIQGFLRSVAPFLTVGLPHHLSLPSTKKTDGEDEDEEDTLSDKDQESGCSRKSYQGTVLITLRDVEPYTSWQVPKLAKKPQPGYPRYIQLRSFAFNSSSYPGYHHRRTMGYNEETEREVLKPGKDGAQGRTWQFALKLE